jgi:hypothetical protein
MYARGGMLFVLISRLSHAFPVLDEALACILSQSLALAFEAHHLPDKTTSL